MNIFKSSNINQLWARLIVEELIRNGIVYFCISPGSRSAPLTCAVAEHPKAQSLVHFDERGSAFHALGYACATGKPAVVITTSGSALANIFPAVIEASKKKQPLIILTADRPPELRSTGANQTIDQVKIFGEYVRFFFDMPCPDASISPEFVLTMIDQTHYQSQGLPPGPVHLNCMFREPLAPAGNRYKLGPLSHQLKNWQVSHKPYTQYICADKTVKPADIDTLQSRIERIKNGIIVVGKLKFPKQQRAILKLSQKLNWPIFPDITSGLRAGSHHPNVIEHFDQLLFLPKFQKLLNIDGVLHFGGRITSQRWYDFIKQQQPKEYILTINHSLRNDPLHCVTLRLEAHISQPCEAVVKKIKQRRRSQVLNKLKKASVATSKILMGDLYQNSLTESATVRVITQLISLNHALFLGSSLPVREVDMFTPAEAKLTSVNSNRGASGIDGTIASAIGYAEGLKNSITVLTGDLSMLYDLNSLAMLKTSNHSLTIIVLNNNGGGIFSFLPIVKETKYFEKFFGTPHNMTFNAAADMFDINYARPETIKELANIYQAAREAKTSTIIEVQTDRKHNVLDHDRIRKLIQKHINPIL